MKAADQRTKGEKREREETEQTDEESMEQDTTNRQQEQDATEHPQEVATGSNSPVTYSIPDEHTSPTNPENMDVGLLGQIHAEANKLGISEIYSPPRVTKVATELTFPVGFALDLSVNDPVDDKPWDFTQKHKRERAIELINTTKPILLIGSPPCTSFSTLFKSNISRMKPEVVKRLQNEGVMHLRFCVELYNMQCDNGRYFVHEHPYSASSWGDREMLRLIYREGVVFGKGHMCRQGMALCDAQGPGLALKATGWLTNSSLS
jgi:hypothetical protein